MKVYAVMYGYGSCPSDSWDSLCEVFSTEGAAKEWVGSQDPRGEWKLDSDGNLSIEHNVAPRGQMPVSESHTIHEKELRFKADA